MTKTRRLSVQLTHNCSPSVALLMGTPLGCTKVQLSQGSTQQFASNFLRPLQLLHHHSRAVPWDGVCLPPASAPSVLFGRRKMQRGFSVHNRVRSLSLRLQPGSCATEPLGNQASMNLALSFFVGFEHFSFAFLHPAALIS